MGSAVTPSHVVELRTEKGEPFSFCVAFKGVGEFTYALSHRRDCLIQVQGVGSISPAFLSTPADIVSEGVWVDAINHLNDPGLTNGAVMGWPMYTKGHKCTHSI